MAKHRRRKGGRGARKGAGFEREVCKALSRWVSGGKAEDLFWRSSMSGGRATVARQRGGVVRQAGDIVAVHNHKAAFDFIKQWYVECKFYRKVDLDSWLIKGTGRLAKWWKRCRSEANYYERQPMLIVKQNGWPILVITNENRLARWCPLVVAANGNKRSMIADIYLFSEMLEARYAT